jgi:hypothetical protein
MAVILLKIMLSVFSSRRGSILARRSIRLSIPKNKNSIVTVLFRQGKN